MSGADAAAQERQARDLAEESGLAGKIIRSIVVCAHSDSLKDFREQIAAVRASRIGFRLPEDQAIWQYVDDFETSFGHAPGLESIKQDFACAPRK